MKHLLLLAILVSANAHAFLLNTSIGASFKSSKVNLKVTSNSTCTNAGITNSELLAIAVEGGEKFWNTVPSSNLEIKNGGLYTTSDANFLTGKLCVDQGNCNNPSDIIPVTDVVIACNSNTTDNFTSSNVYALSAPNNLSGSNIAGSIILINDTASTPFNTLSREEMVNVLAHEIGHAIGIGHSKDNAALMYFQNLPHRNKLGQDDIDAVTFLYPNKLDGCGSIFGFVADNDDKNGPFGFILTLLFGLILGIYALKHIFITMEKNLIGQAGTTGI